MKYFFILLCLIFLINSIEQEEVNECNYRTYEQTTYDYCKGLAVNEGKQCCVVVESMLGKNEYFCHPFDKGASEEDIDKTVNEDFIMPNSIQNPGVIVRARTSCSKNVEPYSINKCNPEESQKAINFQTCQNYNKDTESDYCCLFSAKAGESSSDVYFCEELNEAQAQNMDETVKEIDSHYEMYNVKYMNCSPKIPDPDSESDSESDSDSDPDSEPDNSFGLNFNLFLLVYLLILII